MADNNSTPEAAAAAEEAERKRKKKEVQKARLEVLKKLKEALDDAIFKMALSAPRSVAWYKYKIEMEAAQNCIIWGTRKAVLEAMSDLQPDFPFYPPAPVWVEPPNPHIKVRSQSLPRNLTLKD